MESLYQSLALIDSQRHVLSQRVTGAMKRQKQLKRWKSALVSACKTWRWINYIQICNNIFLISREGEKKWGKAVVLSHEDPGSFPSDSWALAEGSWLHY